VKLTETKKGKLVMSRKIMTVAVKKSILGGMFKNQIIMTGVAVCLIIPMVHAELDGTESAPVEKTAAVTADTNNELYRMMFEGNLINAEEYQNALEYGCLSGDGIITNAAIEPEMQITWDTLYTQGVITAEELVQMLSDGTMDDLPPEKMKAFEELAPVYEPDMSKRVRYDIRKKHIIVDLIRLEQKQQKEEKQQREDGIKAAKRLGMSGGDGEILKNSAIIGCSENGLPIYVTSHNRVSAEDIKADKIRGSWGGMDFNLSGSGVKVALRDVHLSSTNHQAFGSGRITQKVANSVNTHATAVCGTIAADGVNTNAHGMAENVKVDSYVSSVNMPFSDLLQSTPTIHVAAYTYGQIAGWNYDGNQYTWWDRVLNSSSTESGSFGRYEFEPKSLDATTFTASYILPVVSVGNDTEETFTGQWHWCTYNGGAYTNDYHPADGAADNGYDTLNPMACSKNALVVGAGNAGSIGGWPSDYSSCGPTDDGRIKPDVIASGGPVYTTSDSATNGYVTLEGSSFSSSAAAGTLAMLQELHERFYGNDQPMLASTWRGLLIHTADPTAVDGPDYKTGWGIINAYEAARVISNNVAYTSLPHIKEIRLYDGETIEFNVQYVSNSTPFKFTMAWTDPAGVLDQADWTLDGTNLMLVNDLDMRVIGPNGDTNFPFVLDPQSPTNIATKGDNYRDNVEQIIIPSSLSSPPDSGTYRVIISHKGSLTNGFQDVAVIITDNTPADAPEFKITEMGLIGTNGASVQLDWPGVVGGRYDVMSSTNLLNSGGWTNVEQSIIANSTNLVWTNTLPGSVFYRLKRTR